MLMKYLGKMGRPMKLPAVFLLVILMLLPVGSSSDRLTFYSKILQTSIRVGEYFPFKTHRTFVRIHNEIAPRTTLTVHCQSRDDDLGFHKIAPGAYYQFSFYPHVFFRTLFFCSFSFHGQFKYFDVYIGMSDFNYEVKDWRVHANGPCTIPYLQTKYRCYPWNPPSLH